MKLITLKGNPLSTNNIYYHAGKGLTFIKAEAKALKEDYGYQILSQWKDKPLEGDIEIKIKLFFGTKRKVDWDNYHKLSMDAMNKKVWIDDSQIIKATVEKFYDKENPRTEIEIFDLSTTFL